jgi:hypothetical protein
MGAVMCHDSAAASLNARSHITHSRSSTLHTYTYT